MKRKLLSLFAALCLLTLASCSDLREPDVPPPSKPETPSAAEAVTEAATEAVPETTAPAEASSPTEPLTEVPAGELDLAAFLTELALWEEPGRVYTFVRDDIGLRIPGAPYLAENLLECLVAMELRPFGEGQAIPMLPHPFSLLVETNGMPGTVGTVDTIALTAGKVTVNGTDYSPANPTPLVEFLEGERGRFLTGDPFLLQTEMPFTDDDIAEIRLTELENYSAGETVLVTKNRADISRIARGLNQTVARRLYPGEEPAISVGGNAYHCALTLADGTTWSMDYTGNATVTTAAGSESLVVHQLGQEEVFGLLERNYALPQLTARIVDGAIPTVYEKAYTSPDAEKTQTHLLPAELFFGADFVLLPTGNDLLCTLEWVDGNGTATPTAFTATVYPDTESWVDPPADSGKPLVINETGLVLPGGEGRRFVALKAEFDGGVTAEHIFAYRVSMFPSEFYDIGFGNEEGDVALIRSDAGVSVTGSQNRKYVDFVLGLELSRSNGEPQKLPAVRKPFALLFHIGDETCELVFSAESGLTVNYVSVTEGLISSAKYAIGNPEAIETLYEVDLNDLNTFDRINTDMRGFFTKDVAYFAEAFPFAPEQVAGFTVIREEPEQRIRYDCGDMPPDVIGELLGYVVVGKDWRAEDPYIPRRFFYSYELALADGTVYTIGERILKNGEDTGWYTIQSNALVSESYTGSREGAAEQREKPIRGGISVYDDGTFAFD